MKNVIFLRDGSDTIPLVLETNEVLSNDKLSKQLSNPLDRLSIQQVTTSEMIDLQITLRKLIGKYKRITTKKQAKQIQSNGLTRTLQNT